MNIGFVGYPFWCQVTADYLTDSPYDAVLLNPILEETKGFVNRRRLMASSPVDRVSIVHALHALNCLRWVSWFRLHGRRVVLHWVGADCRRLIAMSRFARRRVLTWMSFLRAVHLMDSPDLAEELARVGVHGEVIRLIPAAVNADPSPLPEKPAVLASWPDASADFYGRKIVYALARRWPAVPFRIVGPSTPDPEASPNVEFLGYQEDLDPVYRACSVLIRVLPHDSLGAMVLEALARGRDAIYSKPFPHARLATDEETAAQALAKHLAEYRLNEAGAQYVAENFKPDHWAGKLCGLYKNLGIK